MQVWVRKSANGRMLKRVDMAIGQRPAYVNDDKGKGPWLSVVCDGTDMVQYRIRLTDSDLKKLIAAREYYTGPLYNWNKQDDA
jgi:aminopeptidase N